MFCRYGSADTESKSLRTIEHPGQDRVGGHWEDLQAVVLSKDGKIGD